MHPVLEQIISARPPVRPEIFRLWQQQLRDIIHPLVEAGEIAQAMADDAAGVPARRTKGR